MIRHPNLVKQYGLDSIAVRKVCIPRPQEFRDKSQCPSCNAPTKEGVMYEENEPIPIKECTKCTWWGSA